MKITCSRCGLKSEFSDDESDEVIANSGWTALDYWRKDEEKDFVLEEYYICPHCAAMFERFMGNKSTGNESSPHVDSVSKNICPACQGEKTINGGKCPWCNGSGLKEGWNE